MESKKRSVNTRKRNKLDSAVSCCGICANECWNVTSDVHLCVCDIITIGIWRLDHDFCQGYAGWCQHDLIGFPEIRCCHAARWLTATDWSSSTGSLHFPPSLDKWIQSALIHFIVWAGQKSAFLVFVLHVNWVKPSIGVKPKLSKVSLVADLKATSMMFDVSYLYSKGNVSLVSRLILDAGLTAELVKVWSEQTMWVPQCVPVL